MPWSKSPSSIRLSTFVNVSHEVFTKFKCLLAFSYNLHNN
ncbi:hypothetical protein PTUN_a2187 [Pseudoalteromonas tunicata]|nr:hypothetical protein PTUN_a2187 [Pseudoalteromonas tunicata]